MVGRKNLPSHWNGIFTTPPMRYDIFRLEVSRIGFTQEFCSPNFRDGRSILETAQGLIKGLISPPDLPIMEVVWHRHRFFSVDNRRLAALRLADMAYRERGIRDLSFPLPLAVNVRLIDELHALRRGWDSKFETGLWAGRSIRVRPDGLQVGRSLASTTFGCDLVLPCKERDASQRRRVHFCIVCSGKTFRLCTACSKPFCSLHMQNHVAHCQP